MFPSTSITCTYTVTGVPPVTAGVTRGTMAMSCAEAILGCRITGTVPADYTNATTTTNGLLRIRGTTGLASTGCILSGTATLAPDPLTFTVTNGVGGSHPTNRFGPILRQP